MDSCAICGGSGFVAHDVLWPGLIAEWRLSPEEAAYINRQQGLCCAACGGNLRSIALAQAICQFWGVAPPLADMAKRGPPQTRILEINPAGTLTPVLSGFPQHRLVCFPEVDMQALPFADGAFDLVVHSDTLEHVEDPVRGLRECRRVLAQQGACIFTVPIVVGRLTGNRAGRPPSYHGQADLAAGDQLVHTEFGADAWTACVRAGFRRVAMAVERFPDAMAIVADF
jgi:SAM-dependent methyltransferase